MRIFKKLCLFLVINILMAVLAYTICSKPSEFDKLYNEFEDGNYNSIIMGQSLSECGINPYILSSEEEMVFNFSRSFMTNDKMLVLLQELNDSGSIKTVYVDIDPSAWNESDEYYNEAGGGDTAEIWRRLILKGKAIENLQYVWNVMQSLPFDGPCPYNGVN